MAVPSETIKTKAPALSGLKLLGVALFLILVWGSAFTLVGAAVRTLAPEWLVAYRMGLGAVVVITYSRMRGHRLPPLTDKRWIWYLVMGFTGASLPFVLISHGQKTVDSGLTAIIVGAMPLITIILAHFFTEEKLTSWKLFGFVMGFIGIIILFLPKSFTLELIADWKAQLLILIASASYAATTIIASRAPDTPSPVAASMMLLMGAILSFGWAFYATSGLPPIPEKVAFLSVIGLALGSTGAATIVYLWVVDVSGPSVLARINYFVPVCSVVLGVLFLGEILDWRIFVSLFVILLGVIISRFGGSS